MTINLIFNFTNFCIIICFFFTKLLTPGILFSAAVNAELIARPVILGLLPSISVILAFKSVFQLDHLYQEFFLSASLIDFSKFDLSVSYVVFKTNPVVSMLFTLATNLSYSVFLTTSFFTTLFSLAKSLGTGVSINI